MFQVKELQNVEETNKFLNENKDKISKIESVSPLWNPIKSCFAYVVLFTPKPTV